jgi:hypothetical protein
MPLNVKTGYGAVGNYNPATGTGADDTTAFTNAIAAAVSTGEELYVPHGNYKITASLGSASWLAGSGARIYGSGNFTSNIYLIGTTGDPSTAPQIQLSGQNSYFRDIGVVGQNNCNNLLMVGPHPPPNSAGVQQDSYIRISNCRFTIYSATDSLVTAVNLDQATYSTIDQCVILGQPFNSGGTRVFNCTGISFNASVNNTVTNSSINFFNIGILVNATSTPSGTQGALISSNAIFGNATGVNIQSVGQTAYASVVNNVIDACSVSGVVVEEGTGSITSNYIGVSAQFGTASSGIIVSGSTQISIVGNSLVEYNQSPSGATFGIIFYASVNNSIINSNTISSFNTSIYIGNTCQNCVVTSNSGTGYTVAFISNNSSTTSLNNNTT